MLDENPLVSVLMTAYNRELYIGEAIESVLKSTYTNFELIIVDDCSADKTVSIAKKYQGLDSRIFLYVNKKNLNDYPNRNKAASYAKGEYIMFVDSDDKIFPDGIQNCLKKMQEFPQADMGIFYNDNDYLKNKLLKQYESIKYHFFKRPILTIGPGGTILKRDFFDKIGKYPEQYGPANDMYFNLKAASKTDILIIGCHFFFYRIHEGQEKNNHFNYLYNNYNYLNDALDDFDMKLSKSEIIFLKNKNRRRLITNSFCFLFKEKNVTRFFEVFQLTKFTFRDFFLGIFN